MHWLTEYAAKSAKDQFSILRRLTARDNSKRSKTILKLVFPTGTGVLA